MKNKTLLRIISVVIVLLTAVTIISCGEAKKNISVNVRILCESENMDYSIQIEVPEKTPASECFKKIFEQYELSVKGLNEGFVTKIGDVANNNKDCVAWLFKVNNEYASTGIKDYKVKSGDSILFEYADYTD